MTNASPRATLGPTPRCAATDVRRRGTPFQEGSTVPDPAPTASRTRRAPVRTATPRTAAVRASLSPLGSPRANAVLAELAARGAAVPAPVLDRDATVVGVLVSLHDVGCGRAVAGGVYTVRDDATVEVVGPWSTEPVHRGLARRVLWELEAEARRRGFTQAVAPAGVAGEQAEALRAGGYTADVTDVDGAAGHGKQLTRP
ncbi:hypothetical protein GCM10027047_07910 [Rhodococcus aerolatus]